MLTSFCSQFHTNEFDQESEYVGPWQLLRKITNVLCSDGSRRTFWTTNGVADTFFSIPGHVSVKGKTVTGFVWAHDGEFRFTAGAGKNQNLLPEWGKIT